MKRALLLLLLISCTYEPTAPRYIIDGDTVVLNNGDTIRLAGIDTPEKGDANYDRAAYELQRRIINAKLELEGTQDDMYGRKVRFVTANGKNVNVEMVREGWARTLMHKGTKYEQELEQAQTEAIIQQKGIWKVDDREYKRLSHRCAELGCPGSIAISSTQGEAYYNCACSTANLIAKENIQCHPTLQDAILKGLRETRRC
ncbi:thermonuclease family protein [Candidatus Woesearchaeota archaeon]|nr:thermonuclease family protein [Candidatus Woesearchaeota archaeon]